MQWMPHHQTRTSWQCETSTHIKCFMKWQRSLPWTLWPFKLRLLRIYFVNILLNSLKYCLPLCHLPLRGQPFDFWWGIWVIWLRIFSQTSRAKMSFPPTCNNVIFFFQCRKFFPPGISLQDCFSPPNQLTGYFFSEITHTPFPSQKSNGWPWLRIAESFKCFGGRGYHTLRG